ncbi:mono/diheme cytochrome c family protein [Bradyrhizobium sp. GM22.5]
MGAALPMRSTSTANSPAMARLGRPWVTDVAVNKSTGEVSVTRVVAGQDSGLMINPDGVRHQIHGNVIQSTSRALMEEVSFERGAVAAREWGAYPIIPFPDVPKIDVLLLPRPDQPPLGVGESASVPSAAAIANAIFDATGVRFREPPFTPERILNGLHSGGPATRQALPAPAAPQPSRIWENPFAKRAGIFATVAAVCTAAIGIGAAVLPGRAIAPIARPDPSVYSAATIARGQQLAALGNCAECHTMIGGALNAGGRALETPFGTIYATNITPDVETGIGVWSYPAFERAMRDGLHRDGRQLYPAFPYTHFSKTGDADMQALYAYLMAQPAVRATQPANTLAFPFNLRPLLAGWNALFHQTREFKPDPAKSKVWNRGAYLVEGLGHCSACHSPRNTLGAEQRDAYLAGGFAEGWEAPPLTSLSQAPIPWNEDELFAYLRTGHSRYHGVAAGPMAPIVRDLAALPDQDIRAMAVYLNSFNDTATDRKAQDAIALKLEASTQVTMASSTGARLYQGACAVCHEVGGPGAVRQPPLARPQQQPAQRHIGQSRANHPARHRRAGVEQSRLYAGLQEQHERCAGRGAGHLPAQAVRTRQASMDRCEGDDCACESRRELSATSCAAPAACRACETTRSS